MLCSALVWQALFVHLLEMCQRIILYLYNRIYCPWRQDMVSQQPTGALCWLLVCTFIVTLLKNTKNDTLHNNTAVVTVHRIPIYLFKIFGIAFLLHLLQTVERDRNKASAGWIWTKSIMYMVCNQAILVCFSNQALSLSFKRQSWEQEPSVTMATHAYAATCTFKCHLSDLIIYFFA